MEPELVRDLMVAVGLGLLIGMQREWAEKSVAGIRTFALIALAGALCGLLSRDLNFAWLLAAGLLAVAWVLWIGNQARSAATANGSGVTTEVAALVVFLIGAAVMVGHAIVAVVTAGVVALLLHAKGRLHAFVDRLGEGDFRAIARLILIGMVILPLLPDENYGPYDVLNPFRIWLMVVLIVGISLAAYVARLLMGAGLGVILAGVLGGLISSTATTVSYARRARAGGDEAAGSSIVLMVASTIVFARVLFEIALVAPSILASVAPPLAAMMALMAVICLAASYRARSAFRASSEEQPPSDLTAAVVFGVLYAGVLIGVSAVRENFGDAAMYLVAALSGLTDMDAITLSSAQLMKSGAIETAIGWRLILVGAMANLLFKLAVIALIAGRSLAGRMAVMFGVSLAGGALLLWLWPA